MGSDPWGLVMKPVSVSDGLEIVQAMACKTVSPPAAAANSPSPSSTEAAVTPSGTQTQLAPLSINAAVNTSTSTSSIASSSPSSSPSAKPTSTKSVQHQPAPTHNAPEHKATLTPPPPSTTSTPPPKPAVTQGTSGGPSGDDIGQYLAAHNGFRAQHNAPALSWNDLLASKAQEWANKCHFQHSGGQLGPFGENLAAGSGSFDIDQAVQAWKDEESDYDPKDPQASHFTQVVWKGSTQLGCAHAQCDGIFDGVSATFHVCEYQAQGNVIGEFGQNVQA